MREGLGVGVFDPVGVGVPPVVPGVPVGHDVGDAHETPLTVGYGTGWIGVIVIVVLGDGLLLGCDWVGVTDTVGDGVLLGDALDVALEVLDLLGAGFTTTVNWVSFFTGTLTKILWLVGEFTGIGRGCPLFELFVALLITDAPPTIKAASNATIPIPFLTFINLLYH